jgi:excisionase family DNA binding protein
MSTHVAKANAGPLWSIHQVADYLSVPVATVRHLRGAGRMAPAIRIGRHLRWNPDEVIAWAAERREKS